MPLLPMRSRPFRVLSPAQRRLPPPMRAKSLRNSNGRHSLAVIGDGDRGEVVGERDPHRSASASNALLTSSLKAFTKGL